MNHEGRLKQSEVKLAQLKANNDVDTIITEIFNSDVTGLSSTENVVRDEIIFRHDRIKTIVIGELWPSWLSAFLAIGYRPTEIITGKTRGFSQFFSHCPTKIWKPISRLNKINYQSLDMVFISGTTAFLLDNLKSLTTPQVVCLVEGNQPHRRVLNRFEFFEWKRFKHWNYGGISNAQYWIGWKGHYNNEIVPGVPSRYLIHVLGSAAKGFQIQTEIPLNVELLQPKVVRDQKQRVIPSGLIPINEPLTWVISPSLFSKTKWV